ncbi:T9SS type A sorting domain-containing protein [Tenacibaculum sp. 190524A02b]|uniref:T9SS type A sorting domain-containing protein n=1 Tax=Tenacibaculum vairaonense TaxID=3137860 RepID=UPI0031FAB4CB
MKNYCTLKQCVVKSLLLFVILISQFSFSQSKKSTDPIILAYFPSWSESYAGANQDSKLRNIPNFVNYVFLSFAKPDLVYEKGSYDLSKTGIEVPYDGCLLKESVSALKDKGIKVILSVGGETFWRDDTVYERINYQQIKDLVDDLGCVGIDWDFEPSGSFATIGNTENVQHFIDFFNKSRALMPRSEGYVLACAPSGVGALGGQTNNDTTSPFAFEKRNTLTGENDDNLYKGEAQTNGINLFGFSATGHMIPVIKSVGDKIDIIAYQGYNAGGSKNRAIMYDAYAHYAKTYGFDVVAGIHYPDEPWGPFYEYTHENTADLSHHITNHPDKGNRNDGIMIWQLLMKGTNSSAYSYLNVASKVLNGTDKTTAISQANDFSLSPYTGGAQGCGSDTSNTYCDTSEYVKTNEYPTTGTKVYYECKIWKNKWWANPNEIPGEHNVWEEVSACNEGPNCTLNVEDDIYLKGIDVLIENKILHVKQSNNSTTLKRIKVIDLSGRTINSQLANKHTKISLRNYSKGIYIINLTFDNQKSISLKTLVE